MEAEAQFEGMTHDLEIDDEVLQIGGRLGPRVDLWATWRGDLTDPWLDPEYAEQVRHGVNLRRGAVALLFEACLPLRASTYSAYMCLQ